MRTLIIDPGRSRLAFTVRRLIGAQGVFAHIVGKVVVDEQGEPQSLEVSFPARSLNTRLLLRDLHLKTASFLDARRYPTISYHSQRIERAGPNQFVVHGQLRLHGRERPVRLEAEVESDRAMDGAYRAHVTGVVTRSAFNVPRNPLLRTSMLPMIGDEVVIMADVVSSPEHERSLTAPHSARQSTNQPC